MTWRITTSCFVHAIPALILLNGILLPWWLVHWTYTNYHSFMQIIKHVTDLTRFTIYFQTALEHHPKHLGVLFQGDSSGTASDSKSLKNDSMFFVKMTNDDIAELDPVTNQCPCLICTPNASSNLSILYAPHNEIHDCLRRTWSKSRLSLQNRQGVEIRRRHRWQWRRSRRTKTMLFVRVLYCGVSRE